MTTISFLIHLKNDLNTHSGINTVKKEMMAKQITKKELISWISKMISLKSLSTHKSPRLNLYYKIDLRLYSLLQKYRSWKFDLLTPKILKSDSFFILGFQTLPNYLSICCEYLVHWVNHLITEVFDSDHGCWSNVKFPPKANVSAVN